MWLFLNYVVWHYWHPIFYAQNPYRNHTVQKFDIGMHSYLCMLVHINFRIPSSVSTPLSVSCTILYVYTYITYIWRWLTSQWVILIQFDYPVRRALSEYVHTCILLHVYLRTSCATVGQPATTSPAGKTVCGLVYGIWEKIAFYTHSTTMVL